MDFRQYRYVMAIDAHGSFTKAARALYISQPSLSIYIQNLENRLGFKLFDRGDGRVTLTAGGGRFIEYGRKILALDRECAYEMKNIANVSAATGRIVLGLTHSLGIQLLPRLVGKFNHRYPNVQFILREGMGMDIEEMLHRNELDIALFSLPFRSRTFDYTVVWDAELLLAVHKSNPLCEKAKVAEGLPYDCLDLEDLRDVRFILLNENLRIRTVTDQIFAQIDAKPKIMLETASSISAYKFAVYNVAPTFVTEDLINEFYDAEMNYYHVGDPRGRLQIACAYASQSRLSDLCRRFIDLALEVVGEYRERRA